MAKKYYTVMVLPDTTSKMRKYRVPKDYIKGALISAAIVSLLVLGLGFRYWQMSSRVSELEGVQKEFNQQRVHLQNMEGTIDKFKKDLTEMTKDNQKFRIMVGLPEARSMQQLSGIGGEGEQATFESFVREIEDTKLKKLCLDVERLKIQMSQEQGNLQEITETVEDKASILVCTPAVKPANGWITSGFGYRQSPFTNRREIHRGLDIANRFGTPIVAPADGTVTLATRHGELGKTIVIEHGYGYSTRYGHMSEFIVQEGDKIKRGQMIGRIGSTGRSTAPHLHYEVRLNGVAVNPYNYILD
ncbi:MAG: M23 family metallopeptidase [Candidatus Schekmanbacteria bacterium]|nr:M23 family metallopeptidase [Candidatus Schekmanbacteria bacterium]